MHEDLCTISDETGQLLTLATATYQNHFDGNTWFGRCIFLSWYCDVGTCKFCYRSTQKDRIKFAGHAKRTPESVIVESLLAKNLGWRIEFLTGGYRIYPFEELVECARLSAIAYGEKIWLNLGALNKEELLAFAPHIKGVVASIETINPDLHNHICPNKPIAPYEEMFSLIDSTPELSHLQKSMTMVVGLGEQRAHFAELSAFITKHRIQRMTFYALKPIAGTGFTKGPSTDEYAWWIAKTRIAFPHLQIIAGTTADRVEEVEYILLAGANAITKFPATKMFGTSRAQILVDNVARAKRTFTSRLLELPPISLEEWDAQIETLDISDKLKEKSKLKIRSYLTMMENAKYKNEKIDEE